MSISLWLLNATKQLKKCGVESNRLDAELILAHTLRQPRTYLHAHLDDEIDERRLQIANARLDLRLDRVPLAYILGYKEFYGRDFIVSPAVLVPRPESETIISLFCDYTVSELGPISVIDIGTGSGCLGVTAKLERPNADVTLTDVSAKALYVAKQNAIKHNAHIHTIKTNLLHGIVDTYDFIFANLPYVCTKWHDVSPELTHEPDLALYADDEGKKLIFTLLTQVRSRLTAKGKVIIESDPTQQEAIIAQAIRCDLTHVKTDDYCVVLGR